MKIFVSTLEIIYVGEKDFIYNHKGKKYNIKKGDILVMSDDYYSKYLLNKPFFEKFTPKNKTQEAQEAQEVQETQEDNALAKEQKEAQEAQEVQETQEDNKEAQEAQEVQETQEDNALAKEQKRSSRSTRSSRVQNSSILEFAAQQE